MWLERVQFRIENLNYQSNLLHLETIVELPNCQTGYLVDIAKNFATYVLCFGFFIGQYAF